MRARSRLRVLVANYPLRLVQRLPGLKRHGLELPDITVEPRDSLEPFWHWLARHQPQSLMNLLNKKKEDMVIVMHKLLVHKAEEGILLIILALLLIGVKEYKPTKAIIEQIISALSQNGYH